MYEIIDETLKIASCSINDLTLEQASSFLSTVGGRGNSRKPYIVYQS